MSWILVLLLLGIVAVCVIINLNSKDEEYVSDRALREVFLKEYIDSNCCVWVKLKTLPKSFKIGNVYFDKCVYNSEYYQSFLSYAVVDIKVYDNGTLNINRDVNLFLAEDEFTGYYENTSFCLDVSNKDLMNYILNNLDKVEEIKNVL